MYQNNPNISIPANRDTVVWKYLDLSKFLDLLMSKKLFMSRSDKFEDQYEGTFSEPTFEEIRKISENNPEFLDTYKSQRKMLSSAVGILMNMNLSQCGRFLRKIAKVLLFNLQLAEFKIHCILKSTMNSISAKLIILITKRIYSF